MNRCHPAVAFRVFSSLRRVRPQSIGSDRPGAPPIGEPPGLPCFRPLRSGGAINDLRTVAGATVTVNPLSAADPRARGSRNNRRRRSLVFTATRAQ